MARRVRSSAHVQLVILGVILFVAALGAIVVSARPKNGLQQNQPQLLPGALGQRSGPVGAINAMQSGAIGQEAWLARYNGPENGDDATPTPTPRCCQFQTFSTTGVIAPGLIDIGNHCDDCTTLVTFPFAVNIYGLSLFQAYVSSNGNLQFTGNTAYSGTSCPLPDPNLGMAILAFQGDLRTDAGLSGCAAWPNGCGVFVRTTGTAPSRQFHIDWHAVLASDNSQTAEFEIRLFEGAPNAFQIFYAAMSDNGANEETGVQESSSDSCATTFSCQTPVITNGLQVDYIIQGFCPTPTPTPTGSPFPTPTATARPTVTATATFAPTVTPTATFTPTATATATLTPTPIGTHTPTPTPTPTATSSPTPTATFTPCGVQEAWATRYNGPANNDDAADAIALDTLGNVYVTGYRDRKSVV